MSKQRRSDRSVCADISMELAAAVDSPDGLHRRTKLHLDSCLRCQAELAAFGRLRRALRSMQEHRTPAENAWMDELIHHLRPVAPVHELHRYRRRRRPVGVPAVRSFAALGGMMAAATAASAGALLMATRIAGRPLLSG